ncbi:MAG: VanZ family protein [Endomicrobiia bacterium]
MNKTKKILAWFYVVNWCGIIFFLSSIPELKIEELGLWDLILRKIAHLIEYLILSVLVSNALFVSFNMKFLNSCLFSFVFSVIYAISDEIHQYFVPGRHFSLLDVFIDTMGIIFGIILWIKFLRYRIYKNHINLENKNLVL